MNYNAFMNFLKSCKPWASLCQILIVYRWVHCNEPQLLFNIYIISYTLRTYFAVNIFLLTPLLKVKMNFWNVKKNVRSQKVENIKSTFCWSTNLIIFLIKIKFWLIFQIIWLLFPKLHFYCFNYIFSREICKFVKYCQHQDLNLRP